MRIFFLIGIIVGLIGCKPLQRIERGVHGDVVDMIEEKFNKNSNLDYSMERMRIEIKANKTVNVNGKVYIMQNQAIFMTVQFFGLEMARILITEDSVKYINRAERNYFFVSMKDIRNKYYKDISLSFIQNILVNGLILPDNFKIRRLSYYMKYQDDGIVFSPDLTHGQNLKMFYTRDMLLKKINFLDNRNILFLNADIEYNVNNRPDRISAEIVMKSDKYKIEMNVGRIENKNIKIPDMRINNSYSEIIL